jgi:glucose/arabinose dehydrogenase
MGGDEINIIERGANYGWPISTFGIDYNGQPIPESKGKIVEGVKNPFHVWEKSPAISGMAFYNSDTFKQWDHSVFIGALAAEVLIRLELKDDKVVHEERLLGELKARIRDVRQGPDGYLYVLTDDDSGKLLKVGLAK